MSVGAFIWKAWMRHGPKCWLIILATACFALDQYLEQNWNGLLAVLCLGTLCVTSHIHAGAITLLRDLEKEVANILGGA